MNYDNILRYEAGVKLETAVLDFKRDEPPTHVRLVGVTHVGRRQYYCEIKEELASLEQVLYELVLLRDGSHISKKAMHAAARPTRSIAAALNERYFSQCMTLLQEKENTAGHDARMRSEENIRQQFARDRVVTQLDEIPYDAVPFQWIRADATLREIVGHFGLFSKTTASLAIIGLAGGLVCYVPLVSRIAAEKLATRFTIPAFAENLNRFREGFVYEHLQRMKTNSVGILYGIAHIPALKEGLEEQGYKLTDVRFKTALRFRPD